MLTERIRLNTMVGIALTEISRAALAKRADIRLNTINRFLRGDGSLTLSQAYSLCIALEYEPAEFFGTDIVIHIRIGKALRGMHRYLPGFAWRRDPSKQWPTRERLERELKKAGRIIDDNPRVSFSEVTAPLNAALGKPTATPEEGES